MQAGKAFIAEGLLRRAYTSYEQVGCGLKLRQLEAQFPALRFEAARPLPPLLLVPTVTAVHSRGLSGSTKAGGSLPSRSRSEHQSGSGFARPPISHHSFLHTPSASPPPSQAAQVHPSKQRLNAHSLSALGLGSPLVSTKGSEPAASPSGRGRRRSVATAAARPAAPASGPNPSGGSSSASEPIGLLDALSVLKATAYSVQRKIKRSCFDG